MKMVYMYTSALLAIALFIACSDSAVEPNVVPDIIPSPAITTEYVINELTKSEYRGRLAGTAGNETAGKFLQEVYERIGLAPHPIKNNYRWEYLQTVYNPDTSAPQMVIHFANGTEQELMFGRDFTLNVRIGGVDVRSSITVNQNGPNIVSVSFECENGPVLSYSMHPVNILPISAFFTGFPAVIAQPQQATSAGINILSEVFNGIPWNDAKDVSFRMMTSAKEKHIYNIVGYISGRDNTKAVIVGAHYDAVGYAGEYSTPGALDNASGVAAVIHTAVTVAAWNEPPETDIIFVAWNGEENGLWGSNAFVEEILALEIYDKIFYVNFDCVGSINNLPLSARVLHELTYPLIPFFEEWGIDYEDVHIGNSDHVSFYVRNIPYINLAPAQLNVLWPLIHHGNDIKELLDYTAIDNLAKMAANYIQTMGANLPVRNVAKKPMVEEDLYRIWRRNSH